jgi:hypothetical protein
VEVTSRDKHSSLLLLGIMYSCKKFIVQVQQGFNAVKPDWATKKQKHWLLERFLTLPNLV